MTDGLETDVVYPMVSDASLGGLGGVHKSFQEILSDCVENTIEMGARRLHPTDVARKGDIFRPLANGSTLQLYVPSVQKLSC